jgi:radical SAM superfamily enzyme YgiQ (UPF0313 family)
MTSSSRRADQTEAGGASRPVNVGLVQINNSFSGQCYLPYAVALLQSHLEANLTDPGRLRFLLPVFVRRPVDEIVGQLQDADVVLFSVYVWNLQLSLAVARRLKANKPDTWIVFGGPQIPSDGAAFLAAHPFVDVAVCGEGEPAVLSLMEGRQSGAWRATAGITYRTEAGLFVGNPKGPRLADLNSVPSPYLTGMFDPLMRAHPDQKWIALWETNRGCPFSCTFCDWGAATASKVYQYDMERLHREADWFSDHAIDFVFCCDANFGILPRDLDIVQYVAARKRETGFPHALSVQGTKNATERAYEVQKTLADAGLNKGVTLSMQSLDPGTLEAVERSNIKLETYQILQQRFTRDRIETYADLILGLPNETYDTFVNGVSQLIEHGQHNRIQFNNLTVLPNSPMADPDEMRRHQMVVVDSPIVNHHGSLAEADEDIVELQPLVISTATMPSEEWVRTRAFSWMTALLHFDKVFQIPIILAHGLTGVSYRTILEGFSEGDLKAWPVLARVRQFFRDYARAIQAGGPEYVRSERFLNVYWPADEFMLIQLVADGEIDAFYEQAEAALLSSLGAAADAVAPVLRDAVRLNQALLKRPFTRDTLSVPLHYNVWEYYRSALASETIAITEQPALLAIDRTRQSWSTWNDYCREVIWFGNKKGAYLYEHQTAGGSEAGAPRSALLMTPSAVACEPETVEPEIAGIY